ncbi:head-tail connector protein [Pontixanthobacter sp.]|uniref:head-tail connector protein n=1 Tax=Pontixanthobacter sp. TaxID=2792078 RepID=UPI003C7AE0E1
MRRVILAPAELGGAALSELKQWLAIQTSQEDAMLIGLLRSAADLCEAFTGTMPLSATCEEIIPATRSWHPLSTRPVHAITGVEAIPAGRPRYALAVTAYEIDLAADGTGLVRVLAPSTDAAVAVRLVAGLAPGWGSLPDGIRRGIIRMAAQCYRQRDGGDAVSPPAAVSALWRPWRRTRLT